MFTRDSICEKDVERRKVAGDRINVVSRPLMKKKSSIKVKTRHDLDPNTNI
jgi:hypothetical protein